MVAPIKYDLFYKSDKKVLFLIATVSIILLLFIVFFGVNTHIKVDEIVTSQYNEQQLLLARQISTGIMEFLDEKVNLVESLGKNEPGATPDEYQRLFKDIYEGSQGFYAIEFINSTGIVVTGYPEENVPIGYDLYENNQQWPIEHAKETGTYCTNPMQLIEGGLGSFIWVPVFEGLRYKGTILAIIKMSTLSENYLETYNSNGYVYMIDRNGQVLFDGSGYFAQGENSIEILNNSNSQYLHIIYEQVNGSEGTGNYALFSQGPDNAVNYSHNGKPEDMIVAYSPIHWNRRLWSVAVVSPKSEVVTLMHSMLFQQAIFVALSAIITLMGGTLIIFLLLRWNKSLEFEVERKTMELNEFNDSLERANSKLKELDKLKSNFVSMVSHELKAPMTAIKTSAELLMIGGDHEQIDSHELISKIIKNVDRQTRTINDLLDIARIESGALDFEKEQVNLRDVIDIAVETIYEIAYDHGIAIKITLPSDLPEITGNANALVTVFVNLINNALKFTPWGGRVEIEVADTHEHVQITVKDNGIGIPQNDLEHIFEKFYKLGREVFEEETGTGLGLAIVKRIIEGHGGKIVVKSREGEGTCFIITLRRSKYEQS
ncbi:MAG: sensor histidine kinase [Methanosarcinales archaeon]|nr:sensor histidine kinase [Methanosarcinales archaeon]